MTHSNLIKLLYLYYSGVPSKIIGEEFGIEPEAVYMRVKSRKLPTRPAGMTKKDKPRWLKEPHIKLLRNLFEGCLK